MADVTPMIVPGMDGMFGSQNGLLGGLILGSLLRNGGLFGGPGWGGDGFVPGPGVGGQAQANMSVMQGIGDIKQAVAVSTAQMETSQALQSSTIQGQISQAAGALTNTVNGVKDAVNGNTVALMTQLNGLDKSVSANTVALMNQINSVEKAGAANTVTLMNELNELDRAVMQSETAVMQAITNDGDKTRALLVQQYEASLNRQLSDANAALAELRSQQYIANATRGVEVNTTNNINQMQAQNQQQQQMQLLTGILSNLANDLQYIRATNQAINIGGTQTANPLNTNTQIR